MIVIKVNLNGYLDQNNKILAIITFGTICLAQLTINIQNQCECSQQTQNQCNDNESCQWNENQSICEAQDCQYFTTQASCLKNFFECSWNGTECIQFATCSSLTSQTLQCSQQNIQCVQNFNNSTNCVSLDDQPQCSSLKENQCIYEQVGYQEGVCLWNNSTNSCYMATQCSQLNFQTNLCQQMKNSCIQQKEECVQLECSDFQNEVDCTYVIVGLNTKTIMPCQYINGVCQQIGNVQDLNAQNCTQITLGTYYWIQNVNNTGICFPCIYQAEAIFISNQYQPSNKCQCSSLLSEQCQQSNFCYWINGECNQLSCNQISDQLSCAINQACMWYNNGCQDFLNCQMISAQNQQQCISSSLNCPIYSDSFYQNCWAEENCIQMNNQCENILKCEQITQQRQCYKFSYACIWQMGKCQQLFCNEIYYEQECKFTFSNLYMNIVQICIWQNGKCKDLTNSNSLDSQQCLQNTLDTYKWTGSSCVSCYEVNWQLKQYLQLPNQCQCFQLYNEYLCLQKSSCVWSNSYCQPIQCSSITGQLQCASNPYCAWFKDQCQEFKYCQELIGASQSDCIVLSINCAGSDGTNCLDSKLLKFCSSYSTQSLCTNVLGKDGYCIWLNGTCQVLSNCQQIRKQQDCQYFKNQCYWSTSCQPISCSIFNTPNTCQYYYQSINSNNPVSCYWVFNQGICSQTQDYQRQLSATTCSINTNMTARWNSKLNMCLKCQSPTPPNPKQCSCSQLISQTNCLQSKQCFWNIEINQCQQIPCDKLNEQQCSVNLNCYWNPLMIVCQQFTSCSALQAGDKQVCVSQSIRCPFYNKDLTSPQCESYSFLHIQVCEDINQAECNQYMYPPYYICQWNSQLEICEFQSYCNQLGNPILCNSNPYCYYLNECKPKTCQQFQTIESCKFTINPNNWNYIQSCSWLNGACISADNLFSEQNCYINSDYTARWSTNGRDGYCIPCNFIQSEAITPKNQCLCSQLFTEYECSLSSCFWQNGICTDNNYDCNQSNQIDCIQNSQCYWIYSKNHPKGGYCQNIPQINTQEFCTRLKGNNSLECLSQTTLCPVSLNGICQDRRNLQTCQSMDSLQLCANSIGQEGYCTYENQSCQVLTNCTQLKSISECFLFDKACEWNTSSGSCKQLFCSSYTTKTNCTYVFQNINKSNIVICVWNDNTNSCIPATYMIQKSFQDCYQTTGGTYHWSSIMETAGTCVSCSLIMIQPKNTCSCTLLNQVECQISNPVCQLNQNNQCVKSSCSEILDSVHCSQQNECMWNLNQCVAFTKCTDLKGLTTLDCISQSLQCQFIQNGICQSTQSLNSCEKYNSQQCTFGLQGSNGLCYWNSTKNACSVISSCDNVTSQAVCQSLIPACKWSYVFNSCVPFQCQDYNYEDQCTNVLVNLNDPQVELCVWQNNKCVPFVDTYYRFDAGICYVNSDHTYRWIKEDKYGVRCQQCYQSLLINIISIIVLNFL